MRELLLWPALGNLEHANSRYSMQPAPVLVHEVEAIGAEAKSRFAGDVIKVKVEVRNPDASADAEKAKAEHKFAKMT